MECLRIALEMERRGHQLYMRALKLATNPDVQTLLRRLIQEEAAHFTFFKALCDQIDPTSSNIEPLPQYEASMAAEAFYPGGLMQASMDGAITSAEALLDNAIQAEEDSIDYYQELLNNLPEEHHARIRLIIYEESRHRDELLAWRKR